MDDEIFRSCVATESPQGVAALLQLKAANLDTFVTGTNPLLLVAAGLQDPGNLGTMIRSAEAFRCSGLVLTERTVSMLNPKTLRASSGSAFRLPWTQAIAKDAIATLRERRFRLFGTSSHQGTPLPQADFSGPVAIFIGNEGAGLAQPLERQMDDLVVIPHSSQVESLNAGIAASLVLYEASRQRSKR